MSAPLLKTKTHIPADLSRVLVRPDLLADLDDGLQGKLTLLSAPPGFGKTTLLASWAQVCPRPLVWLSLDEEDDVLDRFLLYVVAALKKISPEIGQALPEMVQTPQPPPMSVLLTTLINDLADYREPLVLVLDDYHLIKSRDIHAALRYLLEHQPSNFHLVVATRADPPLPIALLRGRGELLELRARDLRFSPDETGTYFREVLALDLAAGDIAALAARTEGWASGLQMAGLSLARRESPEDFIANFSGSQKFIADYLTDEVLVGLADDLRNFLLHTSILGRLSSALCEAVVPDLQQPQLLLETLHKGNLFLVSLDDEQRWFRYHQLFADLLQQRLELFDPKVIPVLHRRASAWFKEQGFLEEATHHALAAKDFEEVAAMLEDWHEVQLYVRGSEQTLMRKWLAAVPEALIFSRPRLCFYHGIVAFLAGQISQAEKSFDIAEGLLADSGKGAPGASPAPWTRAQLEGRIASMRAFISWFQGDIPGIVRWSQQAVDQLEEADFLWRSQAILNLGDAHYLHGDMAAAVRRYNEAVAVSRQVGNFFITMSFNIKVGIVKLIQGQLSEVSRFCREIIDLAEARGFGGVPRVGSFYLILGEALCEQNRLEQAWEYVTRGAALVDPGQEVHILGWAYLTLLRVAFARGDTDRVEENLQKLEHLAMEADVPIWIAGRTAAWKTRLLLQKGQVLLAERVLQEREMTPDLLPNFLRGEERMALARLLIAGADLAGALEVLDTHLAAAQAGERTTRVIQILILKALAHQALGAVETSEELIENALSLAAAEGFVRLFADEGAPMIRLLRRIVRRSPNRAFVGLILAALEPGDRELGQEQPLIDPLSGRELEILRYLQTNLTSTEIARELFIATSTVRSHMKSIYSKLDAHSRREALQIAGDLGLIPRR